MGRVLQNDLPDGTKTLSCYDDDVIASIDANGHKTRVVKDAKGQPLTSQTYTGTFTACDTLEGTPYSSITYQYDHLGNLRFTIDAQNNVIEVSYDTLSRKTYMNDPDMGIWTYAYDEMDSLTQQTDAKGQQIHFQYDILNRQVQKDYTTQKALGSGDVMYTYDGVTSNGIGRLTQVEDFTGTSTFYYDIKGRIVQSDKVIDLVTYSHYATFDALDRPLTITYPNTNVVTNTYNGPELESVAEGAITYITYSGFDANGRPARATYGNGVTTDYTYDAANLRLNTLKTQKDTTVLQDLAYAFDNGGNVTTLTDVVNGDQTFVYDDLDRLTSGTVGASTTTYAYDTIGNMTNNSRIGDYTYGSNSPVDTTPLVISLLGSASVSVEVGSAYADAGATASDTVDGDLTSGIVTTGLPVDTSAVGGPFTITYNVSDGSGNPAVEVTRTVNVVDTAVPVVSLLGSASVSIEVGSTYADAGATASDSVDGDLTSSIVATGLPINTTAVGGPFTITYNVSDGEGNPAVEVTRTVNVVDTTIPVISLVGSANVSVEVGSTYADAGATALDSVDGDLTSSIVTTGLPVDTSAVGGPFTITYNVSDGAGNPAVEVTRTVNVVDTTLYADNFDDGDYAGWTIVDLGTTNAPSVWSATTGAMKESSKIYTANGMVSRVGTHAWYAGGLGWTDYSAKVNVWSSSGQTIGIMFRYQDSNNYYRFSWKGNNSKTVLTKVEGGVYTSISPKPLITRNKNQVYQVEVRAIGDQLSVLIDGTEVINVQDNTFATGSIALHSAKQNGSWFDDVLVEDLSTTSSLLTPEPSSSPVIPTRLTDNSHDQNWALANWDTNNGLVEWSTGTGTTHQPSSSYSGSSSQVKADSLKQESLDEKARAQIEESYGKLPLRFEANAGQTDSQVKFLSRGSGYSLFLTPTESVLALSRSVKEESSDNEKDLRGNFQSPNKLEHSSASNEK
jgi:YD repeat-containing protein